MEHVAWGLYMTAAGMGTVFLLLLALMVVLMLVGRLDVASTPAPAPTDTGPAEAGADASAGQQPTDTSAPGPLSPDLIAAISIAVITHARVRRGQAAPAMRRVAPGSQLFASRWVSLGRMNQNRPWK